MSLRRHYMMRFPKARTTFTNEHYEENTCSNCANYFFLFIDFWLKSSVFTLDTICSDLFNQICVISILFHLFSPWKFLENRHKSKEIIKNGEKMRMKVN